MTKLRRCEGRLKRAKRMRCPGRPRMGIDGQNAEEVTVGSMFILYTPPRRMADRLAENRRTARDKEPTLDQRRCRLTRMLRIQTTLQTRGAMGLRNRNRGVRRLPEISERRRHRKRRSESGSGPRRQTSGKAGLNVGELTVWHLRST